MPDGGPAHQILKLGAPPQNQQTRRGIVKTRPLKLLDRIREFGDLRAGG
jgi:hypothetical protein